jgi:hypothetical protein
MSRRTLILPALVAVALVLAGCGGGGTPAAASGYLNPATLARDLQTGLTASLNDPKSNDYNDPNSAIYQAGEVMGHVSCIRVMPASNDQFNCFGDYNDPSHSQWQKTVQVSSDGMSYQTIS